VSFAQITCFVFAFVLICMCFSSFKKLDWTPADKIRTSDPSDYCPFGLVNCPLGSLVRSPENRQQQPLGYCIQSFPLVSDANVFIFSTSSPLSFLFLPFRPVFFTPSLFIFCNHIFIRRFLSDSTESAAMTSGS